MSQERGAVKELGTFATGVGAITALLPILLIVGLSLPQHSNVPLVIAVVGVTLGIAYAALGIVTLKSRGMSAVAATTIASIIVGLAFLGFFREIGGVT